MIISFKEKDREVIEKNGLYIIELKRYLYKMEKNIDDAMKALKDITFEIAKVWNVFADAFLEVADSMKMYVEVIKDIKKGHTSFRYKAVKFVSKCTGIELYIIWKATRHTWLARSDI